MVAKKERGELLRRVEGNHRCDSLVCHERWRTSPDLIYGSGIRGRLLKRGVRRCMNADFPGLHGRWGDDSNPTLR